MANFILPRRYRDFSPLFRNYIAHVPPPKAPVHIPLLRGNVNSAVNNLINNANQTMAKLGVNESGPNHDYTKWWKKQGTNMRTWNSDVRKVWDNRNKALQLTAQELEYQLPGFEGLASKVKYEPTYNKLKSLDGARTELGGIAHMGDPPFQSPSHLLHMTMHEMRHLWQGKQETGIKQGFEPYSNLSGLAEADAYLFDLEHRHLSKMDPGRLTFSIGRFKRYCDIDDRFASHLPVEPKYTLPEEKNGWGVSEMMDPIRRADLELRYSFIEPELRRELSANNYSKLWQTLPTTFSYQPMVSQSASYNSGSSFLKNLWQSK